MNEPSTERSLVIVTGLSGSGKSVALNTLEDLGYFCIDNLPIGLVEATLAHLDSRESETYRRVALGLDVRGGPTDIRRLPDFLAQLTARLPHCRLLFLAADDRTLIKRYSETRRKHPLDTGRLGIARAISDERALLAPIEGMATAHIETTTLSIHQLRREICTSLGFGDQPLILLIESFAFKAGVPPDLDFAFDARCLPNPHWEPALRPLTGREPDVRAFLEGHPMVREFVTDVVRFLARWLPEFEQQPRSYVTVGIGCTGGKHRSVYVAERVAEHFAALREQVLTHHRELR